MRQIVAVAALLVIVACSTGGASTAGRQPPPLSRGGAEQVMLRADDNMRSAFETPPTARLATAFRGAALQMLEAQAQGLERRGVSVQERHEARTLVFWDPRADEAVLQVASESRVVTPDEPNPPWSTTMRQWWARLQFVDGSWWVVDQRDLAPDRWRPVAPAG